MKTNELAKVIAISGMNAGRACDVFALMVKKEFATQVAAQTNPKFKQLGTKELERMDKYIEEHREPMPADNLKAEAYDPDAGNTPDPNAE